MINAHERTSFFVAQVLQGTPAALVESRSCTALLKRLTDVVCLPASRINHFERATPDHWRLAAAWRGLSELVSESIVATGDVPTIEILLCNDSAKISAPAVEVIVAYTR